MISIGVAPRLPCLFDSAIEIFGRCDHDRLAVLLTTRCGPCVRTRRINSLKRAFAS
jgi:hypothetical protein